MADRRSDDSPVAPPRSLAGPGKTQPSRSSSRSGSSRGAQDGPVLPPPPPQAETDGARTGAAGATGATGADKPRSKGAERIAAIVAASKTGDTTKS